MWLGSGSKWDLSPRLIEFWKVPLKGEYLHAGWKVEDVAEGTAFVPGYGTIMGKTTCEKQWSSLHYKGTEDSVAKAGQFTFQSCNEKRQEGLAHQFGTEQWYSYSLLHFPAPEFLTGGSLQGSTDLQLILHPKFPIFLGLKIPSVSDMCIQSHSRLSVIF